MGFQIESVSWTHQSIGRRNTAQHTYMCCTFRKFRPRRDACLGLWFAEPQPYVRQSVHRNFLYSGLTIRLRNTPCHNQCTVLLMLNMLLLAIPLFFVHLQNKVSPPLCFFPFFFYMNLKSCWCGGLVARNS